jgi:predicted 3-demethylubiquinone-9 3-methyltransferase (glyoxalase superfamily)
MELTTFLMFEGQAEEAMNCYVSLVPDSRIVSIERYDASGPGAAGTVKLAVFELNSTRLMCIDSPAKHGFTFTPAMSFFIECTGQEQLDRLFESLSDAGKILMPPGEYGFSSRFTWIQDRFGVSWQLNVK